MGKFRVSGTWLQPAVLALFICSNPCSNVWCQNFEDVAAIADSIVTTEGHEAAERWYDLKVELAKNEFGDTSEIHMRALYEKYLNQVILRKYDRTIGEPAIACFGRNIAMP